MTEQNSEPSDELFTQLIDAEETPLSSRNPALESLQAELQTLQERLQQHPESDQFLSESSCGRAVELAVALAQQARESAAPSGTGPEPLPLGMYGQYELLSLLGQGGMGAVYQARHRKLGKVVALKVLPGERLQDRHAVARFEREMRAVGQLDHPNIVAAHDAGEINGTHYLVMELVDGVDLATLVRQTGPLPVAEACELIRQAAQGLQHASEHGQVHRDIKPSNLMLTRPRRGADPTVKILDLGLALLDESTVDPTDELTSTGQVMGTIDYMAPEQSYDTHKVDIRADLYSLGATLFKLLTGRAPFGSQQPTTVVIKLMMLVNEPAPDVRELRPDCPAELAAIIRQLLEKNPGLRITPPQALAEALAPWASGADLSRLFAMGLTESGPAKSVASTGTQSSIGDTIPTEVYRSAESAGRPPGRIPRWFIRGVGGAAAALFAAVIIITITQQDGTTTRIETTGEQVEMVTSAPTTISSIGVPPVPTVEKPPIPVDIDRDVATQVQKAGGQMDVFLGSPDSPHSKRIMATDPFPAERFFIYRIEVSSTALTTGFADSLNQLRSLVSLNLTQSIPNTATFNEIARCRRLRQIAISGGQSLAPSIAPLRQLTCLSSMRLHHDFIQACMDLQSLPYIRSLRIENAQDDNLKRLANWSQLRTISVTYGSVSDAAVEELQALNPYARVILEGESRSLGSDPSRDALLQLESRGVEFHGSLWPLGKSRFHLLTREELQSGPPMVIEQVTFAAGVDLTDAELATLSNLPISGTVEISPDVDQARVLGSLANNREIAHLNLTFGSEGMSSQVQQQLSTMPWLNTLVLHNSRISEEQLDRLRHAMPFAAIYVSEINRKFPALWPEVTDEKD